jgi:hypothetical protein
LTERYDLIPSSWVLLDSQSSVLVFKNPSFLSNIRCSSNHLKAYTNGGTQLSLLIGDIKNIGTVWYNPNSLANIFSLATIGNSAASPWIPTSSLLHESTVPMVPS